MSRQQRREDKPTDTPEAAEAPASVAVPAPAMAPAVEPQSDVPPDAPPPDPYPVREVTSIRYIGNMHSGRKKLEFLASGAMFDDNGHLSDRAFSIWKSGFRVGVQKDANGGVLYEVKMPAGEYSGAVYWWHCEPGSPLPSRDWLINKGIEAACRGNGVLQVIYKDGE